MKKIYFSRDDGQTGEQEREKETTKKKERPLTSACVFLAAANETRRNETKANDRERSVGTKRSSCCILSKIKTTNQDGRLG